MSNNCQNVPALSTDANEKLLSKITANYRDTLLVKMLFITVMINLFEHPHNNKNMHIHPSLQAWLTFSWICSTECTYRCVQPRALGFISPVNHADACSRKWLLPFIHIKHFIRPSKPAWTRYVNHGLLAPNSLNNSIVFLTSSSTCSQPKFLHNALSDRLVKGTFLFNQKIS